MIVDIRDYFRAAISEIDNDLIEHNQPILDDIADTILEDSYTITIGNLSSTRIDTTIDGEFDVTIDLFKNGYNDPITNYDLGYCKAIDIQAYSMNQKLIDQTTALKSVISSGISVSTVESNDNLFRYTIQFTVRTGYYY